MGIGRISAIPIFFCLIGLAIAQNSPQDYVNARNFFRAMVKVGPVTWNDTLATYARNYANIRKADCSPATSGGPYGENIRWSTADISAWDAVYAWASEWPYYNYYYKQCIGGSCWCYTQVVWSDSIRIGCARALCNNGNTYVVCEYDPKGNINGQRPYLQIGINPISESDTI